MTQLDTMHSDNDWYAIVRIADGGLVACTQSLHAAADRLVGATCSGVGPSFMEAREAARQEAKRVRDESVAPSTIH